MKSPSQNMVKINTDAIVFIDQRALGVLIVIQNFRGHVLVAKNQNYLGDVDARRAEIVAAKESLLMAWDGF